jgi:protocatechuate 3,4-dioxygenase beta subunit
MKTRLTIAGIVVVIAVVALLVFGPWRHGSGPAGTTETGTSAQTPGAAQVSPGEGGEQPPVEPEGATTPSGGTEGAEQHLAKGVIAGRVVDEQGQPVAEAEIAVLISRHAARGNEGETPGPRQREDIFERVLKSDNNGEFEITGVPDVKTVSISEASGRPEGVTCILVVQKAGYEMEWRDVLPGQCDLRIVLKEAMAVVTGRVIVKATREPVEGARIVCLSAEASSDAEGKFQLKVPVSLEPPKSVKSSVLCYPKEPYYAPQELRDVELVQGAETEGLLFELEQGSAAIQGEIFEAETGQLATGMRVRLYERDLSRYYYFPDQTRVEMTANAADGTFAFEHLRPGTYQLEAIKDAWNCVVGRYQVAVEAKTEPNDVKMYVNTSGLLFVVGTITGPQGRPVERAAVWLLDGERLVTYSPAASDAEGRYGLSFNARPTGQKLSVMVFDPDYELAIVPISPGRQNPLRVDVALNKGTQLAGTVKDADGNPLKDVTVTVDGDALGPALPSGFTYLPDPRAGETTGADGEFKFVYLPPGGYVVGADHKDYVYAQRRIQMTRGADQRCDFTLDKGLTIEGTVYNEKGEPLRVHSVVAVGQDGREYDSTVSGPDGRFVLRTLPRNEPVTVLVLADQVDLRRDETFYYAKVEGVQPGRKDVRVDAKPMHLGSVELDVTDAVSGDPVTRYEVWCSWQPRIGLNGLARRFLGRPSYGRASVRDEKGHVELGRLFPGSHRFTINAEGYESATSAPIEVTSGRTATVRVKLKRSAGN